jgi:3-hydroxyacyl-CoA dehydrogenase
MIFMLAIEQEYDELDMAIRMFQNTMMRARYSSIPVVVGPHGLTLGGGCELNLHADKCCPAAETYIGLVELGVGLIPGGGGTKEFTVRASDEMHDDEPENHYSKKSIFNHSYGQGCDGRHLKASTLAFSEKVMTRW